MQEAQVFHLDIQVLGAVRHDGVGDGLDGGLVVQVERDGGRSLVEVLQDEQKVPQLHLAS